MTVTHHPRTEFGAKQFPEGQNEGLMNFGAHSLKMAARQDHHLPGMGLQPRGHGRQCLLWKVRCSPERLCDYWKVNAVFN